VLENGAEDMKTDEGNYEVTTTVEDYDTVLQAVREKDIPTESEEIAMIPSTYVKLVGKQAEQMLKLAEKLEELDDVQDVYSNLQISDEALNELQAA